MRDRPPHVLATVEARYDEASAPVPDFSGAAEPLCDVLAEALWPGDRESSDALRKFVVFQLTQECKNESFYDECLRDAFQPRNDQDRASGQNAARRAFLRYREGHAGRLPPTAASCASWACQRSTVPFKQGLLVLPNATRKLLLGLLVLKSQGCA